MGKIEGSAEEKIVKYQRRLIPVNIVVIILSLVAALSLFFAPLLQIDVGGVLEVIVEQIDDSSSGGSGSSGDSSSDTTKELMNSMVKSLSGMQLSLSTMTITQFAFAGEPLQIIVSEVADKVEEAATEMVSNVLVSTAKTAIDKQIEETTDEETKAQLQSIKEALDEISTEEVIEKISKLESATPATKDEAIDELADYMIDTFGEDAGLSAEYKDKIVEVVNDMYDKTVANNDGKFTVEACICVNISLAMQGEENATIYTNYEDLINGLLNSQGGGNQNSTGVIAPVSKSAAANNSNGSTNGNSSGNSNGSTNGNSSGNSNNNQQALDDLNETLNTVAGYAKYFVYAMFFLIGIWVILAIFALVHTFCGNKRFMMWYVKLLGFLPCLLFGVAPLLATALLPKFIPESAEVVGIFGAISSLTWISGACYIALWLVSIFWAFPIKHKIRKLKKQIKRGEA